MIDVALNSVQLRRGDRELFAQPLSLRFSNDALNLLEGANGSGKSTLLDLMALRTRHRVKEAVVRTGYADATEVAYLPQQLWDVLDVRISDLVALALGTRAARPPGAPDLLAPVLSNARKDVGALSSGQRQLLMFWLVASQTAAVYVYDEPFRHLDVTAVRYVMDTIEAQAKGERLVIVSEHSQYHDWAVTNRRVKLSPAAHSPR